MCFCTLYQLEYCASAENRGATSQVGLGVPFPLFFFSVHPEGTMASSPQPPLLPLPPSAVASLVKTSILTGIPTPPFTPQRTNLEFDSFHRLSSLYSLGGTKKVRAASPSFCAPPRSSTAFTAEGPYDRSSRRRPGHSSASEETHSAARSSQEARRSPTHWQSQGRRFGAEESGFLSWHRRQKYRKALLTDVLGIDPPSSASHWEPERSASDSGVAFDGHQGRTPC